MSKRNIQYVDQDVPTFLKEFKKQIGYKEGPDVHTKRAPVSFDSDDDDFEENEDDKPTVVVMKKGDLTAEEVEEMKETGASVSESTEEVGDSPSADGKVIFRKPNKKNQEASDLKSVSSSKKQKQEKDEKLTGETKTSPKIKNATLLSFNEEEDEEDSEED